MKVNDIKEVSEIVLYYGDKKEEKLIIAGYIIIDKPLFGNTQKHYIAKEFFSNGGFWSLINEEKMVKKMKNCICIKKACYKINVVQMKRMVSNLKNEHKIVELHLFNNLRKW